MVPRNDERRDAEGLAQKQRAALAIYVLPLLLDVGLACEASVIAQVWHRTNSVHPLREGDRLADLGGEELGRLGAAGFDLVRETVDPRCPLAG